MPHPTNECANHIHSNLRIIPELRSVHIERESFRTHGITLYFKQMYDLNITPEFPFIKCTFWRAARTLLTSDASILEIPEPLWVRFLPKNVFLVATWRLGGLLKNKPKKVVTYAIENNEIRSLIRPGAWGKLLAPPFALALGLWMRANIARIAYGSDGANSTYYALPFVSSIASHQFLELPEASPLWGRPGEKATEKRAIFIGELTDRKGVLELMNAWEIVERSDSKISLAIVGGGQYDERVRSWAEERPEQRIFLGKVPHENIERELIASQVLVAPSKRWGRWREQIGLPIKEGLAHGLTVVTTTETGLAHWLESNDHHVLQQLTPENLANAIQVALAEPLTRDSVVRGLPQQDNRIIADRWLNSNNTEKR